MLRVLHEFFPIYFCNNPMIKYFLLHFTEEQVEVQTNSDACPRSLSEKRVGSSAPCLLCLIAKPDCELLGCFASSQMKFSASLATVISFFSSYFPFHTPTSPSSHCSLRGMSGLREAQRLFQDTTDPSWLSHCGAQFIFQ